MAYTVQQVAVLSGVSRRTLHFYDEAGLLATDSREVQAIVRRHFQWLKQFWMPNRESYAGHADLIVDSDLRKAYEAHHADLPEFLAIAIKAFAETELA
jgi:hypothetical protein